MRDFISASFAFLLLGISKLLPFRRRAKFIGWMFSKVVPLMKTMRNRANENFDIAMPNLDDTARSKLLRDVGNNAGRTAAEIIFNKGFAKYAKASKFSGPGLEVLRKAKEQGKGAFIISAHFGQWEAIRHVLKDQGMETGAVFKPLNNKWLKEIWRRSIELGGKPLVSTYNNGTMEMIRHVRQGGFMAILIDQKYPGGEMIDFLGVPAQTATAVAKLAMKYDVPVVPAFATRNTADDTLEIDFCEAITGDTATDIMQEANDIISRRIEKNPEQWFWLHRRWKK